MRIDDVAPTPQAEAWVKAAFAKRSIVGGGSFALVLDAAEPGYVVKLTTSQADYAALLHFSGTGPHFPVVAAYGAFQGQGGQGDFHAVLRNL